MLSVVAGFHKVYSVALMMSDKRGKTSRSCKRLLALTALRLRS